MTQEQQFFFQWTTNCLEKQNLKSGFLFQDVCKNLFVALDIVLCFFVGEIVGKQKLVGYDIGNTSGHHPLAQKYVKHLRLPTEQEYEDLKRKGLV